jgi:hypothetical protein
MTNQTTKIDLWDGKRSISVRLPIHIDQAFRAKAVSLELSLMDAARAAQREHNGTLAEAITHWVCGEMLYTTRESWIGKAVEMMRPVFEERGYPLPANIRATIAFTSKGHRGKRRGECWAPEASADQGTEIMVCLRESDTTEIVSILTHELCHAAQNVVAETRNLPKLGTGHGKIWKEVAAKLDLEPIMQTNKAGNEVAKWEYAHGGDVWKAWAGPIIEALGKCPHAAIAAHVAKKAEEAKQSTRMLKFEHQGCAEADGEAYIWRASGKATAQKPQVSCPCCGERVDNPHYMGGTMEEDQEVKHVHSVRKKADQRAVARQGRKSVVQEMLDQAAAAQGAREVERRREEGNKVLRTIVDRDEDRQRRRKPNRNY